VNIEPSYGDGATLLTCASPSGSALPAALDHCAATGGKSRAHALHVALGRRESHSSRPAVGSRPVAHKRSRSEERTVAAISSSR
jgi:hypothetical protein